MVAKIIVGFPGGSGNPSANAGDPGLIPGLGRPPEEGNGNTVQYFFLGNPIIHLILIAHHVAQTPTFHWDSSWV